MSDFSQCFAPVKVTGAKRNAQSIALTNVRQTNRNMKVIARCGFWLKTTMLKAFFSLAPCDAASAAYYSGAPHAFAKSIISRHFGFKVHKGQRVRVNLRARSRP